MITKEENHSNKKNIISINTLFIFLIIFYNNETFPSIQFKGQVETIILLAIIITAYFLIIVFTKKISLYKDATLVLFFLLCLIFITMQINSDATGGYFKIIMSLIIGYMLLHLIPFQSFIRTYINIIIILAAYSLIAGYIIRPITFNMPDVIFPRFYNSVGVPMINARFTYIVDMYSYYRNFGIFREPGVYQIFLNFALMFELFMTKSNPSPIKVILIYITIISTFSIPGYIAGAIIILTYVISSEKWPSNLSNMNNSKKNILVFVVLMIVGTMILYLTNDIFNQMLAETVYKLIAKESSYQGRMVAINSNLSVWLERPLFGYGIIKGISINTLSNMKYNDFYSTSHNTSTTGALLSSFGLLFTSMYSYLIFKSSSNNNYNIFVKLMLFIAIMIIINTQLLIYNELLYVIVFFGITRFQTKVNFNCQNEHRES